ncbi:hypothetical protein CAPTEDRAFT_223898 [Capitella teleta]|uniref:EF-hand domain-containing protein n=1 Tax=Capitella teleta TaxID=283909 RepID=R7UM17_CAPTE|nr:hypothetical protein CAPTEDRAFT_223898 [Capitella teleta]|eukprot:ELU04322.1 hypothetical protein CAPTEDRAFT_223898 [Capitella teleta]
MDQDNPEMQYYLIDSIEHFDEIEYSAVHLHTNNDHVNTVHIVLQQSIYMYGKGMLRGYAMQSYRHVEKLNLDKLTFDDASETQSLLSNTDLIFNVKKMVRATRSNPGGGRSHRWKDALSANLRSARLSRSNAAPSGSSVRIFDTEIQVGETPDELDEENLAPTRVESPEAVPVYETSRLTYLRACKKMDLIPSSKMLESIGKDDLVIKNNILGANGTKACAVALVNNVCIKRIDLTGNNMRCQGASYIAEMLMANNCITSLTLAQNSIGTRGLRELRNVLVDNVIIKKLSLSGNRFSDLDARLIADIISHNTCIETLDLSHNNFCEIGGVEIGEALPHNQSVTSLDLSWNHLRRKGVVTLTDGIKGNQKLCHLNLAWNGLSLEGCLGMGSVLETNESLLSLDVSNNRINKDFLLSLLKGLRKNTTLCRLMIGLNPLPSECAMMFLEVVKQCPDSALNSIDLTGLCVSTAFIEQLKVLRQTRKFDVKYDLVLNHSDIGGDEEDFMNSEPMVVLMEYMRQKNMRLVDLFTRLDADGSKSLSRQEFKDGMLSVNIPLSAQGLDNLVDFLDLDGDGEVDFGELMEGQKDYRRKVTIMQMKMKNSSQDLEDNEVYKISKKVSDLLALREKAEKLQEALERGDIKEADQTMEQRKLMAMSRKVQSLLKAKTAIEQMGEN